MKLLGLATLALCVVACGSTSTPESQRGVDLQCGSPRSTVENGPGCGSVAWVSTKSLPATRTLGLATTPDAVVVGTSRIEGKDCVLGLDELSRLDLANGAHREVVLADCEGLFGLASDDAGLLVGVKRPAVSGKVELVRIKADGSSEALYTLALDTPLDFTVHRGQLWSGRLARRAHPAGGDAMSVDFPYRGGPAVGLASSGTGLWFARDAFENCMTNELVFIPTADDLSLAPMCGYSTERFEGMGGAEVVAVAADGEDVWMLTGSAVVHVRHTP